MLGVVRQRADGAGRRACSRRIGAGHAEAAARAQPAVRRLGPGRARSRARRRSPETPTPPVNGQVLSGPALQASMSMLSLAPAARTFGCRSGRWRPPARSACSARTGSIGTADADAGVLRGGRAGERERQRRAPRLRQPGWVSGARLPPPRTVGRTFRVSVPDNAHRASRSGPMPARPGSRRCGRRPRGPTGRSSRRCRRARCPPGAWRRWRDPPPRGAGRRRSAAEA